MTTTQPRFVNEACTLSDSAEVPPLVVSTYAGSSNTATNRMSSSRIVPVAWARVSTALVGLVRFTKKVSSGSELVSPITVTGMLALVWPGRKVSVSFVAT